MRITLIALIFLTQYYSIAQEQLYRFQFSISGQSILNYGTRSFNNVNTLDQDILKVYPTEKYRVDYKNFTFSTGINYKFSINWFNNDRFIMHQNISYYSDNYTEGIFLELTDIEGEELDFFPGLYDSSNVKLGYKSKVMLRGKGRGINSEILFIRKLNNQVNLGIGINYAYRSRSDLPTYENGYVPHAGFRQLPSYLTQQLGLSLQFEKWEKRFGWYLNLNQALLTLKKEKGANYFDEGIEIYPVSHNLDFRFPLTIQIGMSMAFDKIR